MEYVWIVQIIDKADFGAVIADHAFRAKDTAEMWAEKELAAFRKAVSDDCNLEAKVYTLRYNAE